jgi:hypothetical protein
MHKLPTIIPGQAGRPHETDGETPQPSSMPVSPQIKRVKELASRLFNLLPPLDVTDPESFMAETISILSEYSVDMVERVVHAIPRRTDRPTLKLINDVCEEVYAPIEREIERERARLAAEETRRLCPPWPERTEEEQQRVREKILAWRRSQGIPETGLPPRGMQARSLPEVSPERMRAVLADCEARRARREQHGEQILARDFSRTMQRDHPAPGLMARLEALVRARLGLSLQNAALSGK